jgi:hypothetical protein
LARNVRNEKVERKKANKNISEHTSRFFGLTNIERKLVKKISHYF